MGYHISWKQPQDGAEKFMPPPPINIECPKYWFWNMGWVENLSVTLHRMRFTCPH